MRHTLFISITAISMLAPLAAKGEQGAVDAEGPAAHSEHNLRSAHSYFSKSDSVQARSVLSSNQPGEFQLPGSQRFVVMGRDNRFYLSIGGYAKVTASYDFGSPLHNANEFITSELAPAAPGDRGLVQFSAMQSHLCLNFVALPGDRNQIGFFIGTNFLDNYSPTLQFAYLNWRGLHAGYDYSIFSDPAAGPPSIDYEGPNAFTALQTTQVSYRGTLDKAGKWTAGGGVETPLYSVTPGRGTATLSQRIPDIPGYIQYSWGKDNASWMRLSAIARGLLYRDTEKGTNRTSFGWGVQLSGSAKLLPNLTSYYQATYGKGISSHMQDLDGCGMDLLPSATTPGKMESVKAWGGYFSLQYDFSKNVYCSATYSHIRCYADRYSGGDTPWSDQYRYAQYATGNIFWNVSDIFTTGLEYIYGRRVNFGGSQAHDNRLQMMFMIAF